MNKRGIEGLSPHDIGGRPFYHGMKAAFEVGEEISAGIRLTLSERKSPWIYFSEAKVTDKKFPGNSTKSYRSKDAMIENAGFEAIERDSVYDL